MSTILAITATPRTLQAVVRDPAVRLCIQLDFQGEPDARCLIDGRRVSTDPPHDATDALHLVAPFVSTLRVTVSAVALLVKLDDGVAFVPAFAAVDAARIIWPDVPHRVRFATELDIEAMMDDEVRALQRESDDRAERMLDYPRGHFARTRERLRTEREK